MLTVERKDDTGGRHLIIVTTEVTGMYGTWPVTEEMMPQRAERFAREILKKVEECKAIDRQKVKPFWK